MVTIGIALGRVRCSDLSKNVTLQAQVGAADICAPTPGAVDERPSKDQSSAADAERFLGWKGSQKLTSPANPSNGHNCKNFVVPPRNPRPGRAASAMASSRDLVVIASLPHQMAALLP